MEDAPGGLSIIVDLQEQEALLEQPRAAAAAMLQQHGFVESVPHLTLAIVREQQGAGLISYRLRKVARRTAPFLLDITGEIAVLPCRLPACKMALVLIVDRSQALLRLHRQIRQSLPPLRERAHRPLGRQWLPHVALAYLSGIGENEAANLAAELQRVTHPTRLEASGMELTRLDPSGRWLKVQEFPFLDNNPT